MKLLKLYENWRLIIIIFIKINKYYNNNNTIHRAALILALKTYYLYIFFTI